MITYNPKDWFILILKFHKSDTFRRLFWSLICIGIYAGVIVYSEAHFFHIATKNPTVMHSILGFVLLAHFHPTSIHYVYATVIAEQFGYGFGFAAFMMYLIYVADGESKTAHYSIATGFMALGMMLPGMASGFIQEYLGYGNFFIWVFFATIPGLILSQLLNYPADFGKKAELEKTP